MKRRLAVIAGTGVLAVSLAGAPAHAHQLDPAYGSCHERGGQLAGALFNRFDHRWDRNGDGVVCLYSSKQGGFRTADNHHHRH